MRDAFEMSTTGETQFFPGLQIHQSERGIFICRGKYALEIVKKFGLQNSKKIETLMPHLSKLDKAGQGKEVDRRLYRGMIGSLLYLASSRPDILYRICLCARFQSSPRESHLPALKRIIEYIGTYPNYGLRCSKKLIFVPKGYSDADLASCKVGGRKSTSGTRQLMGDVLTSWYSKEQSTVALSTAKAEYISLESRCAQILWLKQQLRDYGIKLCDDTSAINLTKNPILHSRAKHIEIKHHFIRDRVRNEDVHIHHVDTKNQLADIFIGALDKESFNHIRDKLSITNPFC